MTEAGSSVLLDPSSFSYVVGIDIGSEDCCFTVLTPQKQVVIKPTSMANAAAGFALLQHQLTRFGVAPQQIVIGLEATSRYGENLFPFLQQQGYHLCLLHPRQTHEFAQKRGLRAKTDRLDASTIARVLLSGEARIGYVPEEQIASYRELVRLHMQLSDELARDKNEIQVLLVVLFPEFTQVFADPCRLTATAVLQAYPSARAVHAAGVDAIAAILRAKAPRHFGRETAERLVDLAEHSVSSRLAVEARSLSLQIWCEQLQQTAAHLEHIDEEIEHLLSHDPGAKGLQMVPEFGTQTVAVLRAELGEVARFQRLDQVVAYAGLDIEIKQSGKWQGKAKLSKRGSGLVRRMLYMAAMRCTWLPGSSFGVYYHRLLARGLGKKTALMAVMRKMLVIAARLLRTGEEYDPTRVAAGPTG
jgi:transposase